MMLLSFPRRCANVFGATVLLVLVWKFILLLGTAQPIPANDAYGYDGAVVNYLLHGHYCNPSLTIPFPFSGTHIYSIYPPLYQGVLCLWMAVFGTSALAAMWLHLLLFALYALTLLAIFRRLGTPAWAVNLAGLFLFGITFDDRPDGLAQLLGIVAVYAWVRAQAGSPARRSPWPWLTTLAVVLACGTNPEIGGLYLGWIWLLAFGATGFRRATFPWAPLAVMTLTPVALVAFVKFGRPDLWAGFLQHAGQTPSLTKPRLPVLADWLKLVRTIPALLVIALFLLARWRHRAWLVWLGADWSVDARPALLLATGLLVSIGLTCGALVVFTSNWFLIMAYFQPLLVGAFLMLEARQFPPARGSSVPVLLVAVLLIAIRAIGMTTWGVASAMDCSYGRAQAIVRDHLRQVPPDATVIMSTAYLYDAQSFPRLHFLHEDWTHRADDPPAKLNGDTLAILKLHPAVLVLSQFDYYRRYQTPLTELRQLTGLVTLSTTNYARVPSPDSFPHFQQVLQHVSWAPVIIQFTWK